MTRWAQTDKRFIRGDVCEEKWGKSQRTQRECSGQHAPLTAVQERGKEGRLGRENLRLQHTFQKVLARLMGSLHAKFACQRSAISHGNGLASLHQYTWCAQSLVGSNSWEGQPRHEYGSGFRARTRDINQLCFLQQEIQVTHFHGSQKS